ncbi:hypothetical protein ACVIHI_005456 [Bradyrhizobium sp. USDA 4524]
MFGHVSRSGPSGHAAKYTCLQAMSSAPLGKSATPSTCAVCSASQPITSAARGSARRFWYLREVVSVSKMISRSSLTAIPTTAAWGAPL